MNEKLQEQISELLKQGIDLAKTELPETIKEYLNYHFWDSVVGLVFGIILCLASFKFYKLAKQDDYDFPGFIIGLIVTAIFGLASLGCNLDSIIKIKLAPRVYLIDSVKSK